MKTALALCLLTAMLAPAIMAGEAPITLVIHGGAGVTPKELTPDSEAARRETLEASLRAGFAVLQEGGASLDAVEAAIVVLEDSPLFNAGRGSALTGAGTVEMDASIMDGQLSRAGAVGCVQGVRNPIRLAREVMNHTRHVLLVGRGAEEFARERSLPFEPMDYFITPEQQEKLKRARTREEACLPADPSQRIGTVGAVALDKRGNLAAGTSTGGLTNKRPGRVGDSPLIGAGNYAENGVCAVSCTGQGEFFIRSVVAYDVAARMKYGGRDLKTAVREVIHEKLPKLGGSGGLIALDAAGNTATAFNTPGMYHGWIKSDGSLHVDIFKE